MPITARLSRTLHDALGGEAAADLVDWMQQVDTHRVELHDLSELQYARLDSRMTELRQVTDARFGELRHELRTDIITLRMETQAGMTEVREEMRATREEMRTGNAELKVAIAGVESKIDRRFADLVKWSFLFWCGAVAAAALARI